MLLTDALNELLFVRLLRVIIEHESVSGVAIVEELGL
jgi:hypothetical protein